MAAVTLKDIAKECNVSFSTVSKALKGSSEIGESTIALVTETARKMGYRPNMAARALRTNRSYDIGVIFEDSTGSGLQHQYFAEIFDALNVMANNSGYTITFLNSDIKNGNTYLQQAGYRGYDGIVILTTDFNREDIKELFKSNIPLSVLDYVPEEKKASVLSNNYYGMKELVDYIIKKGHKKIAFIHGELSDVTNERIRGYKDALLEKHIQINEDYICLGQYHGTEMSAIVTEKLLSLSDIPTCIIYPDDFAYLGGLKELSRRNLIPGKDISVAGYDGILMSSLFTPALTTYSQNARTLGTKLMELLISQIEGKIQKNDIVTVDGHIVEGASVCSI